MKRGYSLLEVCLALSLVAMMVAISAMSLRGAQVKKQSLAAAETVAEVFRWANLRARAQGFPVAVGVPTDIGKTPVARGYYTIEGEHMPRFRRGYDFGAELPDAHLFTGTYAGPIWEDPPVQVVRGVGFDFNEWYPPFPSDALFVFLPSGEVLSNRSATGGEYRLLVGTRAEYGPPSRPTDGIRPTEYEITAISDPYTISISLQGLVTLHQGLLGGGPGVVRDFRQIGRPERVAFTPTQYQGPNRPPVLVDPKIALIPAANPQVASLLSAPGVYPTFMVRPGGTVDMTVFAQDPDGDMLTVAWECERPGGGDPGTWSGGNGRMRWDYHRNAWYEGNTWHTPSDAQMGDRFILKPIIRDARGAELRPTAQSTINHPNASAVGFEGGIMPDLRIGYATSSGISLCNLDGSNSQSTLSFADLGGTPEHLFWSDAAHGATFAQGLQPKFLDNLNAGQSPTGVGNNAAYTGSGPVFGLATNDTHLFGLIKDGTNYSLQRMQRPPVVLPPPAPPDPPPAFPVDELGTVPETQGAFEHLDALRDGSVAIAADGAGHLLVCWNPSSGTPDLQVKSDSSFDLKHLVLSPDGHFAYGERPDGSIGRVNLTINTGAKTITFGSPITLPGTADCKQPTLSPDGMFLICKPTAQPQQVVLVNLPSQQALPVTLGESFSELVWSNE